MKNFNSVEKLFSYGTLQDGAVQIATFGRTLSGVVDALVGYQLSMIAITDPAVIAASGKSAHPILLPTDNDIHEVTGTVFDITPAELQLADQYEVADYKRVQVQLRSGISAWVYVSATT